MIKKHFGEGKFYAISHKIQFRDKRKKMKEQQDLS